MNIKACSRTRALLWLLLALHLTSKGETAAADIHTQQVALQPSLATWKEAYERCATLGRRLAPPELAAQQAAAEDGLFGPATTQQCTPHASGAAYVWVDVGGASRREAIPPGPGVPGRALVDQCQGLVFNHTSRQAHAAPAACGKRHCFLCSAPQAGPRMSTTGAAKSGRHLLAADSSNCNMAGQQLGRLWLPATSCNGLKIAWTATPRLACRAAGPPGRCKRIGMERMAGNKRLPVRRLVGMGRGVLQRL
jgi:hypothetical protein